MHLSAEADLGARFLPSHASWRGVDGGAAREGGTAALPEPLSVLQPHWLHSPCCTGCRLLGRLLLPPHCRRRTQAPARSGCARQFLIPAVPQAAFRATH